jgi:hypothetical protein
MANKFENIILTLNKFNWIVALVIGVLVMIYGIVIAGSAGLCAGLSGAELSYCLAIYGSTAGGFGAWYIIAGILGIVSGVLGKMKVVGPINDKKFDEIWMMLLIVGIIGCICDGAGGLFIAQAILIKLGGK